MLMVSLMLMAFPSCAFSPQSPINWSGDWSFDKLGSYSTLAWIVSVLVLGIPVRRWLRRNQNNEAGEEEAKQNGQGFLMNDTSAVSCWAQGFGRSKFCGLRLDPLTDNTPPAYSLEPLDLPLPELSDAQAESVAELGRRVRKYSHKHRTDPCTLLRFLRARKYDVDRAERYFKKAVSYWNKWGVRDALTTWNLEAYERCLGAWWLSGGFLGHGLKGQAVAYERLCRCYWPKLVGVLPWHDLVRLDIVHCLRCLAACEEESLRSGLPLGNGILVQDCDGFGWDQVSFSASVAMGRLVKARNFLMPECLSTILVIRAPTSWNYAWSMFKHTLDAGIRAKVKVARPGAESLALLREYISDDEIPAFLGGKKHIQGDPQCRQVLSPGGLPPKEALDRFRDLLTSNGVHDSFGDDRTSRRRASSALSTDGVRHRASSALSVDSVGSVASVGSIDDTSGDGQNSCGLCPRRMECGCSSDTKGGNHQSR